MPNMKASKVQISDAKEAVEYVIKDYLEFPRRNTPFMLYQGFHGATIFNGKERFSNSESFLVQTKAFLQNNFVWEESYSPVDCLGILRILRQNAEIFDAVMKATI